jgi:hypothetical protein
MKLIQNLLLVSFGLLGFCSQSFSQSNNSPQPVFRKGQAQIVRAFSDKKTWIYEELWVETKVDLLQLFLFHKFKNFDKFVMKDFCKN